MGQQRSLFSIPFFQRDLAAYFLMLLFFYLHHFFLLTHFYFKKNYLLYTIFVVGAFLSVVLLPELMISQAVSIPPATNMEFHEPVGPRPTFLWEMNHYLFQFLMVVAFSLLIKIRERWKSAEEERVNAELSYLKAQMNPHFLFNTLNSIYALALEKSDDTPQAVVKLSGMMRYVITEANENYVWLDKEINYISDFIALQKIRLGSTVKLTYKVEGIAAGKKIAPLVLIPFVENAFKYGVNTEENSEISIDIKMSISHIHMVVENLKVSTTMGAHKKSHLGIQTTRNRLQLLYPNKHQLDIFNTESKFVVLLEINLI